MKVTIYELLGMVKDGIAPKKIKVTGTIYDFDEECGFYFTKTKNGRVALGGKLDEINLIYNFNNEDNVEIIEEPQEHKIPKKLTIGVNVCDEIHINNEIYGERQVRVVADKVNEILDYLEVNNDRER
jgi:hypothetical protein